MKKLLLALGFACLSSLGVQAAVRDGGENGTNGVRVQWEDIKEGDMVPDFVLKNLEGNDFKLSSLYGKGKYTLLDFWGSWCIWCIRGLPEMKRVYESYKDKVEFLGIDCREDEDKWRAGVEKYEIPWLHVYNPDGDDSVAKKYGVKGYPWKVLLDDSGKIVKIVMGEDPEFYTYTWTVFLASNSRGAFGALKDMALFCVGFSWGAWATQEKLFYSETIKREERL